MVVEHSVGLDESPLPIWICEENTSRVLAVNAATIREFGYSETEWLQTSLKDCCQGFHNQHDTFGVTLAAKNGSIHWLGLKSTLNGSNGNRTRLVIGYPTTPQHHHPDHALLSLRAKNLFNAITTACLVSVTNEFGSMLYVNDNFTRISGYDENELVGRDYKVISSSFHSRDFWKAMWQMISNGHTWRGEIRNRAKDGSIFWVDTTITPVRDNDGIIREYFSYGHDVTIRTRQQQESTERVTPETLALIARRTSNAVILTNIDGAITWVNEGFERITGYASSEVINRRPGDFMQGPNTSQDTVRYMREKLAVKSGFKVEILNYTRSGRECWLEIEVIPLRTASGEISGYIAFEVDITPLKNAIAELLKTQDLLRAIVENAPMEVFVKDQGGRYIYFNKSFERRFPKKPVRAVLTDHDLYPDSHVVIEQRQDVAVMTTGEMLHVESDRVIDGVEETLYTIKFPLFDNERQAYAVGGVSLNITSRRQAEKALKQSTERINIALNASQVCTWDWDIKNGSVHWEGDVESLLGRKAESLCTHADYMQIIHPDDREMLSERVLQTLDRSSDFNAEFRVVQGDKFSWILSSGKVIIDGAGNPVRIVGINKDITERRLAEDKLRESESRFRNMADHSPSVVWVSDPDGGVIYFNRAWYELVGGTPEEELGQAWQRHIHSSDLDAVVRDFFVASGKRMPYVLEYRVRRKDGEFRWIMESGAPRYLDNGEFLGYVGSCIDMTERKQMEAALQKSEALYRSVIQTQREMICRFTPDSILTFVNDAFCHMLAKPREQLIGESLLNFIPREHHPRTREQFLVMDSTSSPHIERIVLPDGRQRWHEWTDHPLFDQQGRLIEIQSVGNDVTERVEADLEVNRISTRLLLATHAANLGIWEWDVETDTSIWDRKMYDIMGLDPKLEQSHDQHWYSILHPDDRNNSKTAIAHALDGNSDYEFEYRVIKPDAGLRFLNSYGIVQYGRNGKPKAIVGVTWDNTERKLAEIALKESEQRFRNLVHNLSVGIIVYNDRSEVIVANHAIQGLLGITSEDLLLKATVNVNWRLVREDGTHLPFEEYPSSIALRTGQIVKGRIVGVHRAKLNDQVWMMVDAVPSKDETGRSSQVTVTCLDITARILAEKALRQRGMQLKELTDRLTLATTAAHLGIWDYNVKTGELIWDKTMFEIFGKEKESPTNIDTWLDSLHPEDRETQAKIFLDATRGDETVFNTEFRIIRNRDKTIRYIKALGTINRDSSMDVVQIVGVNWDITKEKQKEEEIRKSESRYRSIVDGQREMICRYTASGALTFANRSYLDTFGLTQADLGTHSFFALFEDEWRVALQQLFDGRSFSDAVECFTLIDGRKRWLTWINIPLLNADGVIYEIQAIGQDITERKELEAQQARLDKIVRESYNEIYLFNAETLQFEFANASGLKNLGYSHDQITSMKITDLFHYPNEMAVRILLKTLLTGETDRLQLQMKHRRKDGSYYDIETLIQVFEKDQSFVAIVTDITQKLITEKKLMATIQEKEILIKEIHHRVKNNLQLISSIIYIKMASLKESEIKYFLGDMRQKIRSIALIHERLLQSENLDTVDIADYLGKLVYDLQSSNSRPDLSLQITSRLERIQIDLDTAIYCALIVNELVTNAMKHAFRNLSVGAVEVAFVYADKTYTLTVSDNGVSMPESIAPGESNSFGMHLLEIFVRQLGGKLEVQRHFGTTFIIRFPKKK